MFTTVTLDRSQPPRFPRRCLVCGEDPDSHLDLLQNSQSVWLILLFPPLYLLGWSRVRVPVCRGCQAQFLFQRWGRWVVCILLIIVALAFVGPWFRSWSPGIARRLVTLLVVVLLLTPYWLFEVFCPAIFSTQASYRQVGYDFADEDYAQAFALLNRETYLSSDFDELGLDLLEIRDGELPGVYGEPTAAELEDAEVLP